jgi:hypothetical protein
VDTEFSAAIPEPYQILGLRLRPLSLGRYRLLRRFSCAFVSDESTTAAIADLLLGVAVCSMRCDEFLKCVDDGTYSEFLKRWAKRIGATPPWYLRGKYGRILSLTFIGKHWRKNHSFNFVEKMELFKNFIAESQNFPNYAATQTSDTVITSHWSTVLEISLRSELGWTNEEINEAPLSKAISDHFRHLESQGLVRIFDESDLELGRQNAEALEAAMKGSVHGS